MALTKVIGAGLGSVSSADLDGAVTINESSADKDFRVESNGNANMLFVDGGNNQVGIGTGSMNSYYAKDLVVSCNNQGGLTFIGGTSDTGQYIMFADGTSGADRYRGYLQYDHANNNMMLATDGAEQVRIHSNGVLSASDGIALGVGTANTASNVLDDYEEGTWTPSLGGNASYHYQIGVYTKVGNKVFVRGQISVNLIGTGSQSVITGLPFTSETTTNGNPAGVLGVSYFANLNIAVTYISGYADQGQSRIQMSGTGSSAVTTVQYNTGNFFVNSSRLDFSMTYRV